MTGFKFKMLASFLEGDGYSYYSPVVSPEVIEIRMKMAKHFVIKGTVGLCIQRGFLSMTQICN